MHGSWRNAGDCRYPGLFGALAADTCAGELRRCVGRVQSAGGDTQAHTVAVSHVMGVVSCGAGPSGGARRTYHRIVDNKRYTASGGYSGRRVEAIVSDAQPGGGVDQKCRGGQKSGVLWETGIEGQYDGWTPVRRSWCRDTEPKTTSCASGGEGSRMTRGCAPGQAGHEPLSPRTAVSGGYARTAGVPGDRELARAQASSAGAVGK